MREYTAEHPQGDPITYRDGKRHLWIISVLFPFILPLIGIGSYMLIGSEWVLLTPLIIAYVVIPILDGMIGEDLNNPPEEVVPQLEDDVYYRAIIYCTVPLHVLTLIAYTWFVASTELSGSGLLITAIVCGLANGFAINTAHELGHKNRSPMSKQLAKLALAVPFYGHFTAEHNRGHHKWVATPEDPASSRLGESIYQFAKREIWQAFTRGLELERIRLSRQRKGFWSLDNQILHSYALSLLLQGAMVWFAGWIMVPFLVVHNCFAWFQLTSANYIEHYGLLREKTPKGRYEPCKPHHSWNSNHILSNLTLFNLERHSDHHANPTRSYQSLRDFPDIPRLPNGYFGMYLLSYVPVLWFKVMDPIVLKLPHIRGDLSKVNIDPRKRDYYYARYGHQATNDHAREG